MKIRDFLLIVHLLVAVFAQNERRRLLHPDNTSVTFDDKKIIDTLPTYSVLTKNLSTDEIPIETSLRPVNLTLLELDRIHTENGNICLANAINESKDLSLKYPFQAVASETDVSLNKSTVNKLERMVKRYGGACTLAILRLHETRLPIASYELKYRSSENSTRLNEIFGTEEDIGWSEIVESIKLEYGDHCLLGFFHTMKMLSKPNSDENVWKIDRNNLRTLEIVHGTECIAAVTKHIRIQLSDDDANEDGMNHNVRGRKGDPSETIKEANNDTLKIPEDFRMKYGKSCVSLVPKLVKLMQSRKKVSSKKSFYQKDSENLAKERYMRLGDFEELSATYGRKCLKASSVLLDMRIEKTRERRKKSYYVVPSSMRNDLAWPFYATRDQLKKMAFVHGTQCAMALYELGKRGLKDNVTLANVSITRRADLRIDSTGYNELRKKYGNNCSLALVTLLDIDIMNSTNLRSTTQKSVSQKGNITHLTPENTESSSIVENHLTSMKSRNIETRSTRVKRDEHFEHEKLELERITLRFRKLSVKKQEKVCEYLRKGNKLKNPPSLVQKLLGKSVVNSEEHSGVHFDHKRGSELSMKNRRDREMLILKWACDDRRPNQNELYRNAGRSMLIKTLKENEKTAESTNDEEENSIEFKFRLNDLTEIDKIGAKQVLQKSLESNNEEKMDQRGTMDDKNEKNYEIIDVDELQKDYYEPKPRYYVIRQPYQIFIPYRMHFRDI